MKFENEARRLTKEEVDNLACDRRIDGFYWFDHAPKYLLQWSRLFQSVISHAGSYIASGFFNDTKCGIYKSEGGCRIKGGGDLVLYKDQVRWDYGSGRADLLHKMAHLITEVVLAWDPMDPIDSMLRKAAEFAGTTPKDLKAAIDDRSAGGVFGGDSLSSFFDRNPFSREEPDYEYLRFCRVEINKADPVTVDQEIADNKLGSELLEKMINKVRAAEKKHGRYMPHPMCCSPRRVELDELRFWVNTGTNTKIDGWMTLEKINAYLAGDGILTQG